MKLRNVPPAGCAGTLKFSAAGSCGPVLPFGNVNAGLFGDDAVQDHSDETDTHEATGHPTLHQSLAAHGCISP